ncbi:MAG: tRNA (adenosine(37)-N6)-threonylcarbamoyltransferase complex dimerization subunit type 1 TsaB [Clostridiales bacterium]|nr:tRNA (adenosine(37)-N6)-threonylcarbamoyltransferase complex dimerization subunit type 1 TsaB [Clostridiales bacterium]
MKILAIDTSGLQASAAIISATDSAVDSYITVGEIILNARTGEKSWTHSEILMPGIENLFALTRLAPKDIDYVAYTCGPGSFTGLRIGAASALAFARAINKSAIPVPTLDALAYNVLHTGSGGIIIPMLDARRGQVYTAVYLRDEIGLIERKTDFVALSIENLIEGILCEYETEKHFFLGDGACANYEIISQKVSNSIFLPANNNRTCASSVAVCALEKISKGYEVPKEIEIIYVRAPQAVREREFVT